MWWKPEWKGYTPRAVEAGLYTYEEAVQIIKDANIGMKDTPNEAMIRYDI